MKKVKVVILCGGKGTRLAEETKKVPKPLVKIGRLPILEHIINHYRKYQFEDFILAAGYKHGQISHHFKNDKKVKVVNTGLNTFTGGRIKRLEKIFQKENLFMVTYGDGLSDINIKQLLRFHIDHKKIATLAAVRPPARFGRVIIKGSKVISFKEKKQANEGWINGGFFVFNKEIFSFLKNDQTILEQYPLEKLTAQNQLMAFKHENFWQCMDTIRDRDYLRELYSKKQAIFKT